MPVPLNALLARLEAIAPLELAEPWDNVGLLVEPFAAPRPPVSRALLTIDLTRAVLDEALSFEAELIVAYHPPIFSGLKRLDAGKPAERVLIDALRGGVAIYSPHTALDAAPGGVNDWLLESFGPGRPVERPDDSLRLGRALELAEPAPLSTIVQRVKAQLGLRQLRVAESARHAAGEPIARAAVCAGSGGAVFAELPGFDLYLTGEMRHHDVLAKLAAGASVILCEHTNSERGYLPRLSARLAEEFGSELTLRISECDRDPLAVG